MNKELLALIATDDPELAVLLSEVYVRLEAGEAELAAVRKRLKSILTAATVIQNKTDFIIDELGVIIYGNNKPTN